MDWPRGVTPFTAGGCLQPPSRMPQSTSVLHMHEGRTLNVKPRYMTSAGHIKEHSAIAVYSGCTQQCGLQHCDRAPAASAQIGYLGWHPIAVASCLSPKAGGRAETVLAWRMHA